MNSKKDQRSNKKNRENKLKLNKEVKNEKINCGNLQKQQFINKKRSKASVISFNTCRSTTLATTISLINKKNN